MYLLYNLDFKENDPFFFDFRGRFYYNSSISPTNSKYSRYIFNYGFYSKEDLEYEDKNVLSDKINEYSYYIDEIIEKYSINVTTRIVRESIFWILISLGKLGAEKKMFISIEDFLQKANDILSKKIKFTKVLDKIEVMHYTKILKSFNDENLIKRGVLKDATASFLQNLLRLMGYKNKDSLKYANLSSMGYWCDTYSFILSKWKKKDKEIDPEIMKLFIRKTVKKPIMTNPYSAAYITSFEYFKHDILEEFDTETGFGDIEEQAFKKFYDFINELENKYFLKNNSKEMVNYLKKELNSGKKQITISSNDGETNLIYYKLISKSFDLIIDVPGKNIKKRVTKKYKEIDKLNIDYKKTARSIRANWIHYIDAQLIRDINRLSKKAYMTIHDCLIIDFLSISKFIINANECSNKKIFENMEWNKFNEIEFFSIFIFI